MNDKSPLKVSLGNLNLRESSWDARPLSRIHQERREVKKLPDGERIDLDTLVDWYSELKSGRTPSDHIYVSERKKDPDLAVLFLLDLSLSTDSYADGNRVLDVEKQAVILFAATQKWVILLSDGKPNDYDKYEGKYGIADIKQAIREMHERHINTYAIAIESIARYYLPQMFGQNHYNILSHPDMLIPSLAVLYRRISANA